MRRNKQNQMHNFSSVNCDLCSIEIRNIGEIKFHVIRHSCKEVQFKCEERDFAGTTDVTMEVHVNNVHSQ